MTKFPAINSGWNTASDVTATRQRQRILLVEDHAIMREGTRLLLQQQPWVEVVGEAKNGVEGLEMASSLQPNLVIFDITMPGLNGLEMAKRISEWPKRPKLLVLTAHHDATYLRVMLRLGVNGFVLKSASGRELLEAVESVLKGCRVIPFDLLEDYEFEDELVSGGLEKLSEREVEVLGLLITGQNNACIAKELSISPKTLETHVRNIYGKLGIPSRSALLLNAEKWSLIISQLNQKSRPCK